MDEKFAGRGKKAHKKGDLKTPCRINCNAVRKYSAETKHRRILVNRVRSQQIPTSGARRVPSTMARRVR